jgi:hypothetical protein
VSVTHATHAHATHMHAHYINTRHTPHTHTHTTHTPHHTHHTHHTRTLHATHTHATHMHAHYINTRHTPHTHLYTHHTHTTHTTHHTYTPHTRHIHHIYTYQTAHTPHTTHPIYVYKTGHSKCRLAKSVSNFMVKLNPCYCHEIPEVSNSREDLFWLTIGWLHCHGLLVRQNMVAGHDRGNLLTSWEEVTFKHLLSMTHVLQPGPPSQQHIQDELIIGLAHLSLGTKSSTHEPFGEGCALSSNHRRAGSQGPPSRED